MKRALYVGLLSCLFLAFANPGHAGIKKTFKKAGKNISKAAKKAKEKAAAARRAAAARAAAARREAARKAAQAKRAAAKAAKYLKKKFIKKAKSLAAKFARSRRRQLRAKMIRALRRARSKVAAKIRSGINARKAKYNRFKAAFRANKTVEVNRLKASTKRPPGINGSSRVIKYYVKRKLPGYMVTAAVSYVAMSAIYHGIDCAAQKKTGVAHTRCFNKGFKEDMAASKWAFELSLALIMFPIEETVFKPMCIQGTASIVAAAAAATGNPAPAGASPIVYELCMFSMGLAVGIGIEAAAYDPFVKYVWRPIADDVSKGFR